MDYEYVSWETIQDICFILSEEIRFSGFKPDIIIGIARGGWPVARIIADLLDIKEMKSIQVKSYEDQKQSSKIIIEEDKKNLFIGKKVLICEDIVDSGKSLNAIISRIEKNLLMGGILKTLAIFKKPNSDFTPDHYLQLQNDNWIIFPWEINETFTSLRKQWSQKNAYLFMQNAGVPKKILDKLGVQNENT
ncbi:MAG: phosphoribosyltransferase [Candidatus Lokiarchaeota archaeon]|nr:phosphoribosyltransferase [Candidatus Lokiarchaeota archaeon]